MPREALLDLFESALIVLWARTGTILGVVTLGAIADRVLHNAGEEFPVFASLEVEASGRIQARVQRRNVDAVPELKLQEGIRSVLIEFLTVVGNLTAEILTEELRSDLTALPTNGARPPRAGRKETA